MFIRASMMTRIISGTVVAVVIGFSLAFTYLLYKLAGQMTTASSFFGSAASLMYLSVEGIFLALILFAAYAVLRKKN